VQIIGYSLMAPAPPFPVLVIGYVINGFGLALQVRFFRGAFHRLMYILKDAQANGFVASLKDDAATKMHLLHAAYGLYVFCCENH
jgi:hypothetical protein